MCINHSEVKMGFTEIKHPAGTHMCLIFQDETERRKIIGKFIYSGLKDGEKVAYFADIMTKNEVIDWLKEIDIDINKEIADNNLIVQDTITAYCPNGRFVPEEMLDRLRNLYTESINKGYSKVRASGEMSWALKGIYGSERLMEYESWLNVIFQTHPVTAICQYDANKFSGAMLMDALQVHPMMIVRGQVVHNPYYLSPQLFLEEFSKRKS
jgi:hypothetical protein